MDKHLESEALLPLSAFDQCRTSAATELLLAAHEGKADRFSTLLVTSHNYINFSNVYGQTPLIQAATAGHLIIVQQLVAANANINVECKKNCSALFYAAKGRYWDVVLFLLHSAANPNTFTINPGESPLFFAAQANNSSVVRELIEANADVNFCTARGVSAFTHAVCNGSLSCVNILLETKYLSEISVQSALWYAVHEGKGNIVTRLLEEDVYQRWSVQMCVRPEANTLAPCKPSKCLLKSSMVVGIGPMLRDRIPFPMVPTECCQHILTMFEKMRRPWLPTNHFWFPLSFRVAVQTLCLIARRLHIFLPIALILSFVDRDSFLLR